jgi:hypothetical protein
MSGRGAGLSWVGRSTATPAPVAESAAERSRRNDARADVLGDQRRWTAKV